MNLSEPGEVLILTGPPGAGKSTTAESLAKSLDRPAVHLHCDDFWHFIKQGWIAPYLPGADPQNQVVMSALAAATHAYARGGYFVVVDGIVGPWFLDPFRLLPQVSLHYVVLRPHLDAVLQRARNRGEAKIGDKAISSLHSQFQNLGDLERHVIDTTHQSPVETLTAVRTAIGSGNFRLSHAQANCDGKRP